MHIARTCDKGINDAEGDCKTQQNLKMQPTVQARKAKNLRRGGVVPALSRTSRLSCRFPRLVPSMLARQLGISKPLVRSLKCLFGGCALED
jgi:hypothetical protein